MLATAIALQEVTKQAVHDDMVMDMAANLFNNRDIATEDDFAKMLFQYSAFLSSLTATLSANALLTESQISEMISSIKEMEALTKEVENGN